MQSTETIRLDSPACQRVWLVIRGERVQVDVSVPLDLPIADLIPGLVELIQSSEPEQIDPPVDPPTSQPNHSLWRLSSAKSETPLAQDSTLRDAGVSEGALLRLEPRPGSTAPTLYDDVVDAAARINKAGHPSWNALAARCLAQVGVGLASALWVWFLLADAFARDRAVAATLSGVMVLALAGGAAFANRVARQPGVATTLGWAALPTAAATGWAAFSGSNGYALGATCLVLLGLTWALPRVTGAGYGGYVAAAVFLTWSGAALTAHAAGVPSEVIGAGLAVLATLLCLAVPGATTRRNRMPRRRRSKRGGQPLFVGPTDPAEPSSRTVDGTAPAPMTDCVWARAQRAASVRAGLYVGLAASVGLGDLLVLRSTGAPPWPGVLLALTCAALVGLCSLQVAAPADRAAPIGSAAALTIIACAAVREADDVLALAAFGALLTATCLMAMAGVRAAGRRPLSKVWFALVLARYLSLAAVLPLALWVIGAFGGGRIS